MSRRRLVALLVGLAVTAAACGGGAQDAPDDAGEEPSSGPVPESPEELLTEPPTSTLAPGTELFSPTETDRPLDLSGGVASGGATGDGDDVSIVTDDPRAALNRPVATATLAFETDWTRQTIDVGELLLGIGFDDPRDRIPPIDKPKFEPIGTATWLDEREPGALVSFNDEVRFYPLSILTRHEVVNDRYGDIPVVVTFCPLCNTAIAFDARVDGRALRFGVSGLLRNSDLVMWDDATTSLWQQITGEAVVGELAGTELDFIVTSIVSFGDAVEAFPDALSLARDTGFGINYGTNSYAAYSSSARPFLFDGELDPRFPALSRVVGVSVEGEDKSYPFSVIEQERAVNDIVGGVPVAVFWGGDTADALDARRIADSQSIGTGIAFDRRVDGQALTFSIAGPADTSSGNEEDRFVDAETGSTWTLLGQAIAGPLEGARLETVVHRNDFWFAWTSFFPDAPVHEGAGGS